MPDAVFSIAFAGPFVTFQDGGRFGHMSYGVAASGPMDRFAFDSAHAALGNGAGQTAIEVSLGGLVMECTSGAATIAITGGDFGVEHAGLKTKSPVILTIKEGERLSIRGGRLGSWAYVAFAGQVQSNHWLGSQATHSTSGFGGGIIKVGQVVTIKDAVLRDDRVGEIPRPDFVPDGAIRVVMGPQDQHFAPEVLERFMSDPFRITDAYDRMGMRLSGPSLKPDGALSIPSEPIVRGSVQVSGDGVPTVLLADHQTTGGYPKIATVISCDVDWLTQMRAGQDVRFVCVTAQDAVEIVRRYQANKSDYLDEISMARGTLEQRLMRENLIQGAIED